MSSEGYQLLALGARTLFLALALLVVLRAALYLLRERRARQRLLRRLPDAGMVGEMRDIDSDKSYPLPREGVLGGGRGCDIRLRGLRRRQLNFAFVEGKGVLLTPCRRGEMLLDDLPLGRGAYALHGALLRVGAYALRIRLFAGLPVPHPVQYQDSRQPAGEEELYAPDPDALNDFAPPFDASDALAASAYEEAPDAAAPVYGEAQSAYAAPPAAYNEPQSAYPAPSAEGETPDAPLSPFAGGYPEADDGTPAPFEPPKRRRRSGRRTL